MLKSINENDVAIGLNRSARLLNVLQNEAHIWITSSNDNSDPRLLSWYSNMLSDEEREKQKSFRFARDRDLYLLAHGFTRVTLSRYLKITPDKLVFTKNGHGRPELVQSEEGPKIRFSISHCRDLVACLVVLSIDAGVDVEEIRELDRLEILSEHVLTPIEISRLHNLPKSDRTECFFTFWTLKEAYVKARGAGLSLPLKNFTFYFDAEEREGRSSEWQFESFRPTPVHSLAISLHRENRADLKIRLFEATQQPSGSSTPYLDIKQCKLENIGGLNSKIAFKH